MSGGTAVAVAPGQLGVAADRRQRRAQLVAGVGDEPAHPGLAGLPRGQGVGDVVEHPVQRAADLADLGARIGVGIRHPLGQRDLAPVQRQLADPGGGRGDPAQRPQRAAHDDAARRPWPAASAIAATASSTRISRSTVVSTVAQRQAGDQDVAVRGPGGDQPVLPAVPDLQGVRPAVDGHRAERGDRRHRQLGDRAVLAQDAGLD